MQTEAIFENISARIHKEIGNAQKSIFVAVAWFTNKYLFDELVNKAKNGCTISLIVSNDFINQNSQIDFSDLEINTSKVYKVGNGDTELMHNKFCIIDYSTVITGSYNWSYKAENNFENVVITNGDTTLAEQFISEFNHIRKQYYPDEPKAEIIFPLTKILKRLEILKNYILLEDIEELRKESLKLREYDFNSDLLEIIEDIQKEEFASVINKIQNFISKNQQLSVWTDPEIAALKLEIKNLENQLNAFNNEKIELEKLLSDFNYRHSIELGELVLEILQLRKSKFKDNKDKYEEAEKDYKQYNKQYKKEKEKSLFELTNDEKQELKKNFRKATFLCHPDIVNDKFKEAAQKMFIELKSAYEANDLKRVTEILDNLEKGNYFKVISESISENDKLKTAIAELKRQIKKLESEILSIKDDETFKIISSISDLDFYFHQTKENLEKELKELKEEAKKDV